MAHFELMLTGYIIVTGFVCSAVLGSFWQLFKAEPVGFSVEYSSLFAGFSGVLFCVFAGPFIIVRNSIRGRRIEGRPMGWVVAASGLASLWSFCTGLVILQFVLGFRDSLAGVI